jgi:hypothetical protein
LFNSKANYEPTRQRSARHGFDTGSIAQQKRPPGAMVAVCSALGCSVGNHHLDDCEVVVMHNEAEMHQLMLERMQMLEEALRRGILGIATEDDWVLICSECGMSKSSILNQETRSE